MSFDEAEIIQGFEGQAINYACVANDSNDFVIFVEFLLAHCHTDCGGDGGACVADPELVVGAFIGIRKTADAASLANLREFVFSAREDFMGITLMADIPEELVVFEIEDVMQGDGQLDRAEVAGEVSARAAKRA